MRLARCWLAYCRAPAETFDDIRNQRVLRRSISRTIGLLLKSNFCSFRYSEVPTRLSRTLFT